MVVELGRSIGKWHPSITGPHANLGIGILGSFQKAIVIELRYLRLALKTS